MLPDPEAAYSAVSGRDARWDGRLYLGVATTGIYCRPSCPARTPRPENCQYFPTAAAAVAAGFRACRRCRPDALPGSRDWDARGDLVGRAVRLVADGAMDDGGVPALARRLAVSERHLTRLLVAEVGASPAQLARTRRAHTARLLIEQTGLSLTEIAFAAGFGSIRQFNDVMLAEFGAAPGTFRRGASMVPEGSVGSVGASAGVSVGASAGAAERAERAERADGVGPPAVTLRLAYRAPIALLPLRRSLAAHAFDGVERAGDHWHERVVDAVAGPAVVRLDLSGATPGSLPVTLRLTDLGDLMGVVARVRRWLDLDADPAQVTARLRADALIGPLVAARPGLRVPGAVDGAELAVCAVLGQQVSLAVARVFQGRIARAFGTPVSFASGASSGEVASDGGAPLVTFPRPEVLAAAGSQAIRDAAHLTQARARAVHGVASALAAGDLELRPGADVAATRARLLALPGIGPWTTDYLTLRALHDPDAFMPSDLVLRKGLAAMTGRSLREVTPAVAQEVARAWQPWRGYALQHVWTELVYAPGRGSGPGELHAPEGVGVEAEAGSVTQPEPDEGAIA